MNHSLRNDLAPTVILRLFLYFAASCGAIVLSQTISSFLLSLLTFLPAVSFMALLFAHIGYPAALLSLIPMILIGVIDGIEAALLVAIIAVLAAVIGISLKKGVRPSETILLASSTYFIGYALYIVAVSFIVNGSFSVTEFFKNISLSLDELISQLVKALNNVSEVKTANTYALSSIVKALSLGTYIAYQTVVTCLAYLFTVAAARITKDKKIFTIDAMFDLKPSIITVAVYIICIVFSPITFSSVTETHFYTYLTTNIATILTPIFFFTGIYYLAKIKFKVEHGSTFFPIIVVIISLVFGMIQLLVIYLSFCGVMYSIRYRTAKQQGSSEN